MRFGVVQELLETLKLAFLNFFDRNERFISYFRQNIQTAKIAQTLR